MKSMLISDKEAAARLQSPMNLINRLSAARSNGKTSAMSLFGIGRKEDKKIEKCDMKMMKKKKK